MAKERESERKEGGGGKKIRYRANLESGGTGGDIMESMWVKSERF